jgi:hypothetical protein
MPCRKNGRAGSHTKLEPEKGRTEKGKAEAVHFPGSPDSFQNRRNTACDQEKTDKKPKKEDAKENGSRLVLRELEARREDTVAFVREYRFAKRGPGAGVALLGARLRLSSPGVYRFDCDATQNSSHCFVSPKGKFAQLALDDWGRQAAFLADTDTTKARIRPWQLCYWSEKQDSARVLADAASAFLPLQPARWTISEHARPTFSEDGSKLYFGIAPPPPLADTTLLPEEIVNVEVWAWTTTACTPKRKTASKPIKNAVIRYLWRISGQNRFVTLGSPEVARIGAFRNNATPAWPWPLRRALRAIPAQWEGGTQRPRVRRRPENGRVKIRSSKTCAAIPASRRLPGNILVERPRLRLVRLECPYWNDQTARLTDNRAPGFFNEESDTPDYPR